VQLQGGNSVHMIDAFFDALGQRECLVGTGDDDDDLSGVHDGTDSDGQSHLGDFGDVVVEEAGIGDDGIVGLLSVWISGAGKTSVLMRVRDVKLLPGSLKAICPSGPIPDVNEKAIRVLRTCEKEFDTANLTNLLLVLCTLFLEIHSVSIQNMNILWLNVDMRKQMFVHEGVIRLFMVP